MSSLQQECSECGLLRSTVLATGKNCLNGTEHDFGDHGVSFPDYERDHSHKHCWESENPPCGIKGKHRCCLCEKAVPLILN